MYLQPNGSTYKSRPLTVSPFHSNGGQEAVCHNVFLPESIGKISLDKVGTHALQCVYGIFCKLPKWVPTFRACEGEVPLQSSQKAKARCKMQKTKESKRDRFVRIAECRTQDVLDKLDALAKTTNPAVYEWDDEQVEKIITAIEAKVQEVKKTFENKGKKFTLTIKKESEEG